MGKLRNEVLNDEDISEGNIYYLLKLYKGYQI